MTKKDDGIIHQNPDRFSPWAVTRHALIALGAAAGLYFLLTNVAPADELDKLTTQAFETVVQVNSSCSGVLFHSDRDKKSGDVETYVLTAKHCFSPDVKRDGYASISMFSYQNNEKITELKYTAKIYGKDFKSDLAVVKLNDTENVYENIAAIAYDNNADLRFGQEVFAVGYPRGLSLTYTQGNLGVIEDLQELVPWENEVLGSHSARFQRATPATVGGNSGGPLFTKIDKDYQVIGITTGGWMVPGGHMNYFTPLDEINDYLEKVRKTFKTEFKFHGEE